MDNFSNSMKTFLIKKQLDFLKATNIDPSVGDAIKSNQVFYARR